MSDITEIILISHNLRSAHNIGSLLRTADGLGINQIFLSGYTPYPKSKEEERLPHIANKVDKLISKTALGAEKTTNWQNISDIFDLIKKLKVQGYSICALEQSENSIKITEFEPAQKVAVIVGREVEGVEPEILNLCDYILEIPMFGAKESFNVVQAAAMALYHLRCIT